MSPTRALHIFVLLLFSAVFAQAQKQTATNASSNAETALRFAQTGKCGEAVPALKSALQNVRGKDLKRKVAVAGVRCGMLANQPNTAMDFLRVLNRDFPDDPEVLYVTTHTYSDLSTRAAQQLALKAPNSPQAHELNAESLEMQGKWDLAEKEYQAILQQNPRAPGIHFRLGRLLLSKPNPPPTVADDAKKEFQQELEIDPNNAGAEYVLGELARQAQQWDEAVQHFSQAAKLDAGFGDAFLGLGSTLISQKKFADAVTPLEKAVKLEPQNPAAHYNLATAYVRIGRKQDADKEFEVHRAMMQKSGGASVEQEQQAPANPQQ
jgi:tetratricopeptide (TPR) repeat protein